MVKLNGLKCTVYWSRVEFVVDYFCSLELNICGLLNLRFDDSTSIMFLTKF